MSAPGPVLKAASLALLTFVWGTTWAAITISLRGFPPFTGVALRFAIAAVLLVAYSWGMGIPIAAGSARHRKLRVLHALLTFCASYGIIFWAEQWVPSGLASVLFATFPLMVTVIAHLALPKERMTVPVMAGVVTGFAGIALIFAGDFELLGGSTVAFASVIMLLSPLAGAIVSVSVKRWGSGMHPIPFNASAMILAAGIMGLAALIAEKDRPVVLEAGPIVALMYMAIVGTALTFPLYFWLLDHMEARRLALIGYGTPVVALLVGVAFMGEAMTPRTWIGSAMVVIGVAVASHTRRHQVQE